MKKVLDKSEVAHKWANQLQEEGRTSSNNFYFNRDTIYSYGGHFPIAKHVVNKDLEKVVLFTYRGYSNTTAKQILITRHACSHLNKIYCHTPGGSHILNMDEYAKKIKSELHGLSNARKPEKYIIPAEYIYDQAVKYAKFFDIKLPKELTKIIEVAKSGEYAEYLKKEANRIKRENVKREKEALKKHLELVKIWKSGEGERLYSRNEGIDYLRFNGKRIQTSQGIEIPVEIGKRAYKWILNNIENGCDGNCEYKILDYTVKSLDKDKITIGCHVIKINEIQAIAKQLKWI